MADDSPQPRMRPVLVHLVTASAAALLTALVFGAPSGIPVGSGRSHHETAVAVVRTVHDALFGDAGADPSSHHRIAVALTKTVHDLAFD